MSESESADLGPVARSRKKRKQEWRERQRKRQEPSRADLIACPGHYWEYYDREEPDYYGQIHPEIVGPNGQGDPGPIPPEIDWSDLTAYRCRHCYNECINPIDSGPAETQQY